MNNVIFDIMRRNSRRLFNTRESMLSIKRRDNMSKESKVDKGYEPIYSNLSYRRKFIRTLCVIPFGVIAMLLHWFIIDDFIANIIITITIVISSIIQLIYTYLKWKKTESVQ